MNDANEVLDVIKFEKKMIKEIQKWKIQRDASQKAYDEVISKFLRKDK